MKKITPKNYRTRLRNIRILASILSNIPFVRCVILNGSMASGEVKDSSDIDLLIVAKSGRIFSTRFLATIVTYLTGLKRKNNGGYHGGKFCLNYFLTDNYLIIPHNRSEAMNKYCAENYSRSILVAGDEKLFNKFMQTNAEWMGKYLKSQKSKALPVGRQVKIANQNLKSLNCHSKQCLCRHSELPPCHSERSEESLFARSFVPLRMTPWELMLSGKFGDKVEQILKNIQLAKINRDPRTKKYPDLIVVSDRELRFHPPKNTGIRK